MHKLTLKIKRPFLIIPLLLVWACSPLDLDNISPFKYTVKDFDGISLEINVPKEEPALINLTTGGIIIPSETLVLSNQISSSELTESDKIILSGFYDLLAGLPSGRISNEGIELVLKNFSTSNIDEILNTNVPLNPIYDQLHKLVLNSESFSPYLPRYVAPTIVGINTRLNLSGLMLNEEGFSSEVQRIQTLIVPCAEAVNAAYNSQTAQLDAAKNALLKDGETFYGAQKQIQLNLKNERLLFLNDTITKSRTSFRNFGITTNDALNAQFTAETLDEAEYYGGKIFVISNLVQARLNLIAYQNDLNAAIETVYTTNFNSIVFSENRFISTVNQEVNKILEQLNIIKNRALDNCHNQGGGN